MAGSRARVEPVLIVNDLEIACDAAVAGVGIARIPDILCREAIDDGRLVRLFGSTAAATRPIHALYPSWRFLPTRTRLLLDALAANDTARPAKRGPAPKDRHARRRAPR